MATTIITPGEVVRHSPESDKFPPQRVRQFIPQKEEWLINNVLGWDFWELLQADLLDYGQPVAWQPGQTYALDQYVDYYGLVLRSLQPDNGVDPCSDTDGAAWEQATRFGSACYENLWTQYLWPYLAFVVMASSLAGATYPSGGKGVAEWVDDSAGARSAPYKVMVQRRGELLTEADQILTNMKAWMRRQDAAGTCDFSQAAFLGSCEADVAIQGRRFFLRTRPNGYH